MSSGYKPLKHLRRLYEPLSSTDTMSLLDYSEGGFCQSKEMQCQSPPLYVGVTNSGYCQKEFLDNASDNNYVEKSLSECVSRPAEVGLPVFPRNIVDQQPIGRYDHNQLEYGNQSRGRSQSTRSSISSGFGSSNEREGDAAGEIGLSTTTSISTDSNTFSLTRIKEVAGSSSTSRTHVDSQSETPVERNDSSSQSGNGFPDATTSDNSSSFSALSLPSQFDPHEFEMSSRTIGSNRSEIASDGQSGRRKIHALSQNSVGYIALDIVGRSERNVESNNEPPETSPLLSIVERQQDHHISQHEDTILPEIIVTCPETFESSVEGTEKILITVYKEEKPAKILCEVPKIVKRSLTTGNEHFVYDPKKILDEATDQCNIMYYFKPMFGLWRNSSNQWVIMSQLMRCTENLELRVRFTVPIELNRHNQIDRRADSDCESDGVKDETPSAFPPMNSELLRYLFHQRRHQFRKDFSSHKETESDSLVRRLLPDGLESNEADGCYDSVLYLAVFDELRKRVDSGSNRVINKGCLAKKLEDILPKSMCEDFKTSRWYNLSKRLELKIVWERFHHLLGIACDQLSEVQKESLYIAYINHVEKVQPSVSSEVILLGDDMTAVCVNGERGVVFVTKSLSLLGLDDFEENNKSHDGMNVTSCDEFKLLELKFGDIAHMQASPFDGKKLFLTDILGNELVLPFITTEDSIRFAESVNQYYKLLVNQTREFPCLKNAKIKGKVYVHESIRGKYLVDVLEKHPSKFACMYRRSQQEKKVDVFIKTVQNNETVIQRTSIEHNIDGRFSFAECSDLAIEATSVEDFIEGMVTDGQRGCLDDVLGKDNCKALVKVIKPSDMIEPSALLKKRSSKRKRERKEMEQLKDGQFGAVVDVYAGDFTMTMITKFSGNRYTLLTRIFEMRERRQDIANELEEAMDVLYAVRQHRHIVRQIGTGVAFDWKVLEYSKWGNLSSYFERRALRGAETQDDIMVMTGHWLIQIFLQLALAINYMATKNLSHGGIRAENILIFQMSPTPFIKLSHPGVRSCQIPNALYLVLKTTFNCTPESRIPTLPRPWLAKELTDHLDLNDFTSTLEGDVWAFGTTVAQISTYANTGCSFEHTWGCLDGGNPTKNNSYLHWERRYGAVASDSCDISIFPAWLNCAEESGEKFCDKLNRCWKKVPVLRPTIHELLQSLSILVHNEVAKDVEIYPTKPENSSSDRMRSQEEIPSFSDRDLVFVKKLSSGNFGTVDLYKQTSAKREYAVKDIKNFDHESMKSFIDELRTALRFRHENIVKIEGMTVPSQRIVMEYIEGGSLESKFKMEPYFPVPKLIAFAVDVAKGLRELHRMSILHRDLAARNILLKPKKDKNSFTAVISDFGLSRVVNNQYYTPAGASFAACWYPPGDEWKRASTRTDIWSYGVTVWEMFHKRNPRTIAPLGNDRSLCPHKEIYDGILRKCWKKEPRDRIELREIIAVLTSVGRGFGCNFFDINHGDSFDDKCE